MSASKQGAMAARVIHFGHDDCYRVPVLKNAGYEVHEVESLDELRIGLLKNEQVDAVIISEEERMITEHALVVAREYSPAPLILFRRSRVDLNENLCDRVYSSCVWPEEWLSDTADLIARCRKSLEQLAATREESFQLQREAEFVRGQSRWQRARARLESKRNASSVSDARWKTESEDKQSCS